MPANASPSNSTSTSTPRLQAMWQNTNHEEHNAQTQRLSPLVRLPVSSLFNTGSVGSALSKSRYGGSPAIAGLPPALLDPVRVFHRLPIMPHVSGLAARFAPAFLPQRAARALSAC